MIRFGLYGSGWRAEFFARCAAILPERFELAGVVTRNPEKASFYKEKFGANVYNTIEELLNMEAPDFIVLSIAADVVTDEAVKLATRGIPILMETPAPVELYEKLPPKAMVQVAEQYFLRPVQQAHLAYIRSGKIGTPTEARVSLTNDYHAVSLIRKYLDVGFENVRVRAFSANVTGMPGYGRESRATKEEIVTSTHTIACLEFESGKVGIFDFEDNQHRSFIRTHTIQIKGEKGEIYNKHIKRMLSYDTAIESDFVRKNLGEDENVEGFGLYGIYADGDWVYKNPYANSRLTDDEIAVARTLELMAEAISFEQTPQATLNLDKISSEHTPQATSNLDKISSEHTPQAASNLDKISSEHTPQAASPTLNSDKILDTDSPTALLSISENHGFYPFAEAAQDHYIAQLIRQAAVSGETLQSTTHVWAR
ncbi:MAG: Gfo/Idh/MocA family oxidoreductase [Clostridiales Family XIII bacterium]|jgi:predicted dehydrogenase|nr:Gfo/Idh/MocA family oxidoreductase [Clostridiales Family XIII bacterium]